jgi:hypothetical protein
MLHAAIELLKDLGIWQAIQAVIGIVFAWLAYLGFVRNK